MKYIKLLTLASLLSMVSCEEAKIEEGVRDDAVLMFEKRWDKNDLPLNSEGCIELKHTLSAKEIRNLIDEKFNGNRTLEFELRDIKNKDMRIGVYNSREEPSIKGNGTATLIINDTEEVFNIGIISIGKQLRSKLYKGQEQGESKLVLDNYNKNASYPINITLTVCHSGVKEIDAVQFNWRLFTTYYYKREALF